MMKFFQQQKNILLALYRDVKPRLTKQQRRPLAELAWLVFGQFVTLLLSFVSIKYITSIGTKNYGIFVLLTSITSICYAVYFNPYEQGYVRFLFENSASRSQRKLFLRKFLKGILKGAGIAFILFTGIVVLARLFFQEAEYFSLAAIIVIILPIANQPITGMLNALRLRKTIAILQIAEKALQVIIFIVLVSIAKLTLTRVFWAISAAFSVLLIARLFVIRRYCVDSESEPEKIQGKIQDVLPPNLDSQIFAFMLPFIIWGIFGGLQANGERWIVESLLPTSDVGRYGLAFSLISSTAVVSYNILSQFFLPIIYETFSSKHEGRKAYGGRLIVVFRWIIVLVFFGFACLFGLIGDTVIGLVSTKDFAVGGMFLFMLTMGIGFFYIAQVETTIGLSLCKTNIYLVPKIAASLSSILLYFVGCFFGGLKGTAIAVVFVNLGYLIWIISVNRKFLASGNEIINADLHIEEPMF
jgi:O-antigen/teichoic acid export membrane protein